MPNPSFDSRAADLLKSLSDSRQLKHFHRLTGPMGPTAHIAGPNGQQREVIVLCSNNYLGLANHPEVVAALRKVHNDSAKEKAL